VPFSGLFAPELVTVCSEILTIAVSLLFSKLRKVIDMGQSRKRKPLPQQPQPVKKSFIKVVDKGVILSKIRTAQFSEREVKRRRKSIVLALVLIVALLGYVILVITTAGSNQGPSC